MHIIKFDAIDSTNAYLRTKLSEGPLEDFTVVVAHSQTQGRGQRGTTWVSEAGKNLTFSVYKRFGELEATRQFALNIWVSLSLIRVLEKLQLPDLAVKWPNDILSAKNKICGVLIENLLAGKHIQGSVIGIGLNVNQQSFGGLPKVSSLQNLTGKPWDLDELLYLILEELQQSAHSLDGDDVAFWEAYTELLFRKGKPSTFTDAKGTVFMGFIQGVSSEGMLQVLLEDGILQEYGLKEVQLLY